MMSPLMGAAAFCVLLAGGALAFKSSRSSENERKDGGMIKGFDTFTQSSATVMMVDDFTQAPVSERSNRTRRGWKVTVEENQPNLSPVTEHHLDPDLAGWNEYFDSSNGSKESESDKSSGEHSQISIEDFVNEAERNLLGVRIRYPDQESRPNSTAIVPAPPSSMVPVPSSSIVPAPPNSLVPATPDEIDEASSPIEL